MNRKLENTNLVDLENLICLSNIRTDLLPIDNRCSKYEVINNNKFIHIYGHLKTGEFTKYVNKYLVVGDEIVKILGLENIGDNTDSSPNRCKIQITRNEFNTKATEDFLHKKVRLVEIIGITDDLDMLSYDFTDGGSGISNGLFTVETTTGILTLTGDFNKWSPLSPTRLYNCRAKHTVVYIFKGQNKELILKSTCVTDKIKILSGNKSEFKKIQIPLRSYIYKWFNNDINLNLSLKNMKPKEFFKTVFGLFDEEIYYTNGVKEEDLISIKYIALKTFKQFNELLQNYCANTAIRFVFDKFERVKIFSDIKPTNITVNDHIDTTITDINIGDDNKLVFNTMKLDLQEKLPMYNFKDLNNNYVDFKNKITNAFKSNQMLAFNGSDYYPNTITITNSDMFEKCYLGDYVLARCTWGNHQEFYGKVMNKINPNSLEILFFHWDKDYKTLPAGKYDYLTSLLNSSSTTYMDLYYLRYELPDIFRFTRNKNGNEVQYALEYPLLPMLDGKIEFPEIVNIKFGSASNLKVGEYSGMVDNIEGIFGKWTSKDLLYNMEYTQSHNSTNKPPIYVLSNKLEEVQRGNSPSYRYTTFDNRDLELWVEKNNTTGIDSDARLTFINQSNVLSSQLYKSKERSRVGDYILEIDNIDNYKIGDVLIVVEPKDSPTQLELEEYNKTLKSIRWVIKNKFKETISGITKHYILVNSPFAKRSNGKVYEFIKFPNSSIVYLQEMYIKGNPIISHTQSVVGVSSDKTIHNESSIQLYEERNYTMPHSFLDSIEIKKLMGYILYNYSGVNTDTMKYTLPLTLVNSLHLEPLDIITIKDSIFTQIDNSEKWLVLNVKISSDTNSVSLTCVNINKKDTKPYVIDTKTVLEYKPVEIPKYTNTGTDPTIGDGSSDSEKDEDIGQIWVAKISEGDLTAVVRDYKNGIIYFGEFSGNKKDEYVPKLFQQGIEFVVEIEGEMIFVEATGTDSAMIKKRGLYKTKKVDILPKQLVKFLNLTLHTDVDGTIRGRRIHIGDVNNYFSYDSINGAVFKGKFQIGEQDKTADNDLFMATQNSRVFRQPDEPINDISIRLKNGDMWYNTSKNNSPYIYQDGKWVLIRDNVLGNGVEHSRIYYSGTPITENTQDNDFWINTTLNPPNIYIRKNNTWVDFTTTPTTSIDNNKVTYSTNFSKPTTAKEGDVWFSKSTGFIRYVYKNNQWVDVRNQEIKNSLNGRYIFYSIPKYNEIRNNDYYYAIGEKRLYIKQNGVFNPIVNNVAVLNTNNNKIYFTENLPKELAKNGDLWVDTDNHYLIYYYSNGQWNTPSLNLERLKEELQNLAKDLFNYSKDLLLQIETIGQDGKLTPLEKQSLKKELLILEKNYVVLSNKATAVGVSLSRLNNLKQVLLNFVNPILTNMNTTSDVDSQELRNKFAFYYAEYETVMTNLIQKINDDSKEELRAGMIATVDNKISDFGATINNSIINLGDELRSQLDGVIETHYGSSTPTLSNVPANSWSTVADKSKHIGDLYYSTNGKVYRFLKSGTSFAWKEVSQNDALVKALKDAEQAKDTADRKRRVFITRPTTPYDVGDLWVDNGKIYVSTVNKLAIHSFVQGDWSLATNYVDDTKLDNYKNFVNNTVTQLQGKIDSKIETYAQTSDPSTSWTTPALKNEHIGDLWLNTNTNTTSRWTGTSWTTLKTEDVIARELAQSKATIFTSQPIPPYKINDIWVNKNEIFKAVASKDRRQPFNSSDWGKLTTHSELYAKVETDLELQKYRSMLSTAKPLYGDAEFKAGVNRTNIYNLKQPNSVITITRKQLQKTDINYPPNTSGYVLEIKNSGTINANTISPGAGGFYFGTNTYKGAIFITRIVAKIPVGWKINFASNNVGGGHTKKWVSSQDGTGNYVEYLHYLKCGESTDLSTYSTTNFFYLTHSSNPYQPVTWFVAFAEVYNCVANQETNELYDRYLKTVENVENFKTYATGRLDSYESQLALGQFRITGNTTFDGSANIVSKGSNQRLEITSGGINFYRTINGREYAISSVRNMRYGIISTDSKGKGKVTFTGMVDPIILPTIKSIDLGRNIAQMFCFAQRVGDQKISPTYQFFLYGTNEAYSELKQTTVASRVWNADNVFQFQLSSFSIRYNGRNISNLLFNPGNKYTKKEFKNNDAATREAEKALGFPTNYWNDCKYVGTGVVGRTYKTGTGDRASTRSESWFDVPNMFKDGDLVSRVPKFRVKLLVNEVVEYQSTHTVSFNRNDKVYTIVPFDLTNTFSYKKIYTQRTNIRIQLIVELLQTQLISVGKSTFEEEYSYTTGHGDRATTITSTITHRKFVKWDFGTMLTDGDFIDPQIVAGSDTSQLVPGVGHGEVQYIAMETDNGGGGS